jgi:hypothetical protein
VHLVDEQDGARPLLERVEHGLEALLEVAAIARSGQQRARVEGEDLRALQDLGRVLLQEAQGQPFHERGLAHPGIAHEDGVVLARRARISSARCSSGQRPISGSSFPAAPRSVRFTQ